MADWTTLTAYRYNVFPHNLVLIVEASEETISRLWREWEFESGALDEGEVSDFDIYVSEKTGLPVTSATLSKIEFVK